MISDYTPLSHKAVVVEFLSPYSITILVYLAPHKLLYLFSTLDRLLLKNAMGLSMLLSDVSSLEQPVLLLVCSRTALSPTAVVSVYVQWSSFIIKFIHASTSMMDFALLNIFWYIASQVNSVLADVNFHSDSQLSTMLGQKICLSG